MKTFVTLIRREFWENRGGFLWAPLVVVGLFFIFTFMGILTGEAHVDGDDFRIMNVPLAQFVNGLTAEQMGHVAVGINNGLAVMSLIVQTVLGIVLFFYLIGALYDDRRDRSILFWKSLPVSDLQTVGSKLFAAAFIAPLIAWVAAIIFHVIMLLMISAWLSFHGVNVFKLLTLPGISAQVHPIKMWLVMLLAIPINALWAVPTYGWLLLVSSWARSKAFIWAVAVPLVSGALLSWADMLTNLRIPETWMWLHVIPRTLASVLPYSWTPGAKGVGYEFGGDRVPADLFTFSALGDVLSSANLWIGVALGAAMIAGAVYMRRYREIAD
jgi:ABC-2 type transport system permease protein